MREYLVDLNATQAAIRAGYSADSAGAIGAENLTKPEIQAAIQSAMDERAKRTEITADYVLNTVHETVERCRQAAPVLDRKGQQVYVETPGGQLAAAYTFDAKNVLKGLELLGKHLKLFADRVDIGNADNKPFEVNDAQAAARLAAIIAAAEARKKAIDDLV